MRLFLLTFLTMMAFAGNSLLTRAGVVEGDMAPLSFALIRVAAGAVTLAGLLTLRGDRWPILDKARIAGAISLALYLFGFSVAYLKLDAGLGALILFGVVQISMFAFSAAQGQPLRPRQIGGAAIALVGLVLVLWPGPDAVADSSSAAWMIAAGVGWAAYSILGKGARAPLGISAVHFLICLPFIALAWAGSGAMTAPLSGTGIGLAVLSGAVTSGLGYALWYHVLPQLETATAAVVQLSVPIIAIFGGALLLGEAISLLVAISAALVVGGIALAVGVQRTRSSSGS